MEDLDGAGYSSGGEGSEPEEEAGPAAVSHVGEGLTAVPAHLAAAAPGLRSLCLHGNRIARIEGLAGLRRLADLNLSSNCIAELGAGLAGLSALTALNLACNSLAELGGGLAGLSALRRLNLSHNRLTSLQVLWGKRHCGAGWGGQGRRRRRHLCCPVLHWAINRRHLPARKNGFGLPTGFVC